MCDETTCGRAFLRIDHLQRHTVLLHQNSPKTFLCHHEGCGKAFALSHQLKRHLQVHEKQAMRLANPEVEAEPEPKRPRPSKTFVCGHPDCTYTSQSRTELSRHRREAHPTTSVASRRRQEEQPLEGGYKCTHGCDRIFTRKFAMQKHVQTVHLDLRPFECPICQSSFGHKHLLKRHMDKCHSDSAQQEDVDKSENNVTTEACDLLDASSMILGLSGLAYEAERPFACPSCRARFIRQYDLDRHAKSCPASKP